MTGPVDFFEGQFRRQVAAGDYAFNPFEQAALPFLNGRMLDLGCGLGNLALEAGRRGCEVLAIDGSETAVARVNRDAQAAGLAARAQRADLADYAIDRDYDTVAAIGLLMFFPRETARRLLADIRAHVAPLGHAIINVLIEGTTYLDMFRPGRYHLFGRRELAEAFPGWDLRIDREDRFDAPGGTQKVFSTIVARRTLR